MTRPVTRLSLHVDLYYRADVYQSADSIRRYLGQWEWKTLSYACIAPGTGGVVGWRDPLRVVGVLAQTVRALTSRENNRLLTTQSSLRAQTGRSFPSVRDNDRQSSHTLTHIQSPPVTAITLIQTHHILLFIKKHLFLPLFSHQGRDLCSVQCSLPIFR